MRHVSHGSNYGYQQGCRCDPCRAARSAYMREWVQEARVRAAEGELAVQHGTLHAYRTYGCRCRPCTEAGAGAAAAYRRKQRTA